jgi:hypothetical protein
MTELWSADQRVLAEIVRQIELDGLDFADCYAAFDALELEYEAGSRSVKRLAKAGMLDGQMTLGGTWAISGVTERGLREAGVWPDRADHLAAQLIAALTEAADREPEPERRSKLRAAASGVAGVGRDVLTEVLASYAAKVTGA